jgi:hypothetical protein
LLYVAKDVIKIDRVNSEQEPFEQKYGLVFTCSIFFMILASSSFSLTDFSPVL